MGRVRYVLIIAISPLLLNAQHFNKTDSLNIAHYEDSQEPDKVFHAEPLYVDLIRDLGARKGEKEWNLGFGIIDNEDFDRYEALIEYEFAPINRLGLEIEFPFSFYSPGTETNPDATPSNRLESLQIAGQWSFFVNEEIATSMALGYLNEFELSSFDSFGDPLFKGNVYNPFLVVAKRWGYHFHTLVYTGPVVEQIFDGNTDTSYEINTNLHYMIPGTVNFVGIEMNKGIEDKDFEMTLRPQMRLEIAGNFLVGLVTGIPIKQDIERYSLFLRLIWEP